MDKHITIPDSEGNNFRGILSWADKDDLTKPIVIMCHGLSISKEVSPMPEFEEALNKKGITTFKFDFYGHGESDGNFEDVTISKGVDDVAKAIEFIYHLGFKKIGLLGENFGGLCALLAASKTDKVKVLCLKSPISDYSQVERNKKGVDGIERWKKNGDFYFTNSFGKDMKLNYSFYKDIEKHDTYSAAIDVDIPVIIVHGLDDDVVPVKQSRELKDALRHGKLVTYSKTTHEFNDVKKFQNMLKTTTDFIEKAFKED